MKKTILPNHSNCSFHNWLVYKNSNKQLVEHHLKYKGILYDLGCGNAIYKSFFLQYASGYIGVDWSDSCHNIKADIIADLNKDLPILESAAGTVVSLSVMEHLCEPQSFLNEAFRILSPKGSLILQVPWQWQIHESPHDYFRYTPYGLKYMLRKAGFKEIDIEPQSGFFSMWILKFNYFTKRFIRGPKLIRLILSLLIVPIWTLGQCIAPLLDKLDCNWEAEATGYFVVAKK